MVKPNIKVDFLGGFVYLDQIIVVCIANMIILNNLIFMYKIH